MVSETIVERLFPQKDKGSGSMSGTTDKGHGTQPVVFLFFFTSSLPQV
jgi:hypothetical protein